MSWLKKSFQVQMKVKIAVVASAGTISGRMIRRKILRVPAAVDPGRLVELARDAADELHHEEDEERVGGQELRHDQRQERVRPSRAAENMMYCGTISTWIGNMIVSSMIANQNVLAVNSSRAKA